MIADMRSRAGDAIRRLLRLYRCAVCTTVDGRTKKIDNVRSLLTTAANGFGTGMLYRIGDGAVMV